MQAGFHAEAVESAVQPAVEEGLDHVARRRVGVQVDRRVVGLRCLENVPELWIGQVFAMGVRVDDHAGQAQFLDAALDFLGRFLRVLRRDGDHAGKPRRVAAHRFGQLVVGHFGKRHGRGLIHDLHAGRGQRDDLAVDPGFVHVIQANLVQVAQAADDVPRALALASQVEAEQADETRVGIGTGQYLAVDVEHPLGRERLLGGDAQVVGVLWNHVGVFRCPVAMAATSAQSSGGCCPRQTMCMSGRSKMRSKP